MNEDLASYLSRSGLRITKPRKVIFNVLKAANEPMAVAQIIQACPQIDKVTIYRTMALFAELKIAAVVAGGWRQAYELAFPFLPHHHHLVCSGCGASTEIQSDKLEGMIEELTRNNDFKTTSHHFEISGLCSNCIKLL